MKSRAQEEERGWGGGEKGSQAVSRPLSSHWQTLNIGSRLADPLSPRPAPEHCIQPTALRLSRLDDGPRTLDTLGCARSYHSPLYRHRRPAIFTLSSQGPAENPWQRKLRKNAPLPPHSLVFLDHTLFPPLSPGHSTRTLLALSLGTQGASPPPRRSPTPGTHGRPTVVS